MSIPKDKPKYIGLKRNDSVDISISKIENEEGP